MPDVATASLTQDATNRALRTFLQGLAIDLAVAVAALVLANVDSITDEQGMTLFLIALAKTCVTTVASFVMRRFLDKSAVPTPLPPSPQPEPNEDVEPILGKAILGKAFKGDGGQASLAAATGLFLLAVGALVVVYFVTRDLSAPQAILGKAILGKA